MTTETEIRDRVISLEVEGKHQTKALDDLKAEIAEMRAEIRAMHDLFQQARGARWAIVAMAAVGGFVASKLGHFFPWSAK
jgi:hypothetical protein